MSVVRAEVDPRAVFLLGIGDWELRGHDWLAKRFEEREREARDRVEVIRRFLLKSDTSEVPIEMSEAGRR